MTRAEIIYRIKKNRNKKTEAITLISDFLVISKKRAREIYAEEFENDRGGKI